jgi:hypothetical protein
MTSSSELEGFKSLDSLMKSVIDPGQCSQYLSQNMNRVPPSASQVCSHWLYLFHAGPCCKDCGESSVSFVKS